jgi:hypothetical protein
MQSREEPKHLDDQDAKNRCFSKAFALFVIAELKPPAAPRRANEVA